MMLTLLQLWLETKTKVITLANHKRHTQANEPITRLEEYTSNRQKARENVCVRASYDWFWFYFWLDDKVARYFLSQLRGTVMQTNLSLHRSQVAQRIGAYLRFP